MNEGNDGIKRAPWTQEQVEILKAYQSNHHCHPFTCGNRSDSGHKEYANEHGERDAGVLVPTEQGWTCPVCDYTQNWAHASIFSNST